MSQASHEFKGSVDFNQYELRNATFQRLITPPISPVQGQLYYNTPIQVPFYWNTTKWLPFGLPPVHIKYTNQPNLIAGQSNQISGYIYHDTASDIYYEYLGTTLGTMADYNPIGGSGLIPVITASTGLRKVGNDIQLGYLDPLGYGAQTVDLNDFVDQYLSFNNYTTNNTFDLWMKGGTAPYFGLSLFSGGQSSSLQMSLTEVNFGTNLRGLNFDTTRMEFYDGTSNTYRGITETLDHSNRKRSNSYTTKTMLGVYYPIQFISTGGQPLNNYTLQAHDTPSVGYNGIFAGVACEITGIDLQYNESRLGRTILIRNVAASGNVILRNNDARSTQYNRFNLGQDVTLAPGEEIIVVYEPPVYDDINLRRGQWYRFNSAYTHLKNSTGYSGAATQILRHVSGTFGWVNDSTYIYVHPTYTPISQTLSGAVVLASFTSDTIGSVTGFTTRTLTTGDIGAEPAFTKGSLIQGAGMTLTGTLSSRLVGTGDVAIAHADTSSQASVDNSNGTIIQDITLDTYGHITGLASLDGDARWARLINAIDTTSTWSHTSLQNGIDFTPYTTGSSGYPSTLGFAVAFYANTSDSTSGFGRAFALNREYNTENYYLGSPNTSGVHNGWRLIYHSGNLTLGTLGGVATTRLLTINGVAQDLSVDRTWSVGTVTSVALSLPSIFSVSGSPITTSGTLTATLASQSANTVFAAPDGSAGAPTFRALVAADIPLLPITTKISAGNWGVFYSNGSGVITELTLGAANTFLRSSSATTAPTFATITGSEITGAALTKVDDTNVTLTLGGTPATSLLRATSLTLGWTGILSAPRGGTGIGSYTAGNYINALNSTTLQQRTAAEVRTDLALDSNYVTLTTIQTITAAKTISVNSGKGYYQFDDAYYQIAAYGSTVEKANLTASPGFFDIVVIGLSSSTEFNIRQNSISTDAASVITSGIATVTSEDEFVAYHATEGLKRITATNLLTSIGGVPSTRTLTINGVTFDLSADRTWNVGTVTSVGMTVPTGLSIAGSPITTSGTLAVTLQAGYSIPTTVKQTEWDTAYTNRITSLTTTGDSGAATLISNVLNIPNYTLSGLGGEPIILSGTTSQYWRGDKTWQDFGGAVRSSLLTGYTVGSNTALAATDSILGAFQKVQGQINARISGTIASGQVAFGTGVNTVGGDSGLTWDNTNKILTASRQILFGGNVTTFFSNVLPNIYGTASAGTVEPFLLFGNLVIAPRTNAALSTYFVTNNGSTINWRWKIQGNGALVGNGSSNILVNTGNITIRSDGGNGNIFINPNGTGGVSIGVATSPTNTLDVNGTTRIRTISNLGTAATSVMVPSATGVVSLRTVTEFRGDLGATTLGANLFTIPNPSAITFPRFNADNTVSALSASDFRTAIGAQAAGNYVTTDTTQTITGVKTFNADTILGNTALDHVVWDNTSKTFGIFSQTQYLHKYRGGAAGALNMGQYDVNGNASINNTSNAKLIFGTNNTTRLEIEANGDIIIPSVPSGTGDTLMIESGGRIVKGSAAGGTPNAITITSTATVTIDVETNRWNNILLQSNAVINIQSIVTSNYFRVILRLKQDTTGSRTVTWNTGGQGIVWENGTAPTLSGSATWEDIIELFWDGTRINGYHYGNFG